MCGQSGHLRSECRFRNAECYKCGKVGHLQKACHSKPRGKFNHSNSFHKKAPKKTVHCLEEVADTGSEETGNQEELFKINSTSRHQPYRVSLDTE